MKSVPKCIHCNKDCFGAAHILDFGLGDVGVVHNSCLDEYNRHKKGLKHGCPKCKTTGKMDEPHGKTHTETVPLNGETPMCAYSGCRGCGYCMMDLKQIIVHDKVQCNLCHGEGWLAKEPMPITKIVDWKL